MDERIYARWLSGDHQSPKCRANEENGNSREGDLGLGFEGEGGEDSRGEVGRERGHCLRAAGARAFIFHPNDFVPLDKDQFIIILINIYS